ncbi:MAG: phosphate ABC transporter permease family protein [Methylibium sp.]
MAALVVASYFLGRSRAVAVADGRLAGLHSLPSYHGMLAAAVVLAPMILIFLVGAPVLGHLADSAALSRVPPEAIADEVKRGAALRDIKNLVAGQHSGVASDALQSAAAAFKSFNSIGSWAVFLAGLAVALLALAATLHRVSLSFRARNAFERFVLVVLALCATVAVLTTLGIVFSVLIETYRFFFDPALKGRPTVGEFLFGLEWNPQSALRADQGEIRTAFGFIPLLTGTLLITFIAICVAGPLGLFSAIYLSEYA